MNLVDFIKSRTRKRPIKSGTAVEESFLDLAEKTALIVSQCAESGDISNVGDELSAYTENGSRKEQYVFDRPSIILWVLLLFSGIVFSVGLLRFVPIIVGTAVYSDTYRVYATCGLAVTAAVVGANFFLCLKAIQEIRFAKRYDQYQKVLRYRDIELIEDLSDMVDVPRIVSEKDLKKAVRMKLIPQGDFGKDNLFFLVSNSAFTKYSASKGAYDRYFRGLLENRKKQEKRTPETEELLTLGLELLETIRDSNAARKNKMVAEQLKQMESIVSAISHEIDVNPSQAGKLGAFINYYLMSVEKLIRINNGTDKKELSGQHSQAALSVLPQALDSVNIAFESLLGRYYEELELEMQGNRGLNSTSGTGKKSK